MGLYRGFSGFMEDLWGLQWIFSVYWGVIGVHGGFLGFISDI